MGMRNLTVDAFGDNVLLVSNIPGGAFMARHDTVKMAINSLILDSGIRADCEVFGMFRDLIPVEALNEEENLQRGRVGRDFFPISDWIFQDQALDQVHLGKLSQN